MTKGILSEIAGVKRKKCSGCGEFKLLEDFFNRASGIGGKCSRCKTCMQSHRREVYRKNPKFREEVIRINSKSTKKTRACAKRLCPAAPPSTGEYICPVCGVKFGRKKSEVKIDYPFCTKECYWVSLTKKWQQSQSPYALKILGLLSY